QRVLLCIENRGHEGALSAPLQSEAPGCIPVLPIIKKPSRGLFLVFN
ncbi:hypothetical protein ACVK1V_002546, partial [Bacillus subtilis]